MGEAVGDIIIILEPVDVFSSLVYQVSPPGCLLEILLLALLHGGVGVPAKQLLEVGHGVSRVAS